MKKAFLTVIFVILFYGVGFGGMSGITATTVEYGFACPDKQNLTDIMNLSFAKDIASVDSYLKSGKCVMMKGGLKVTVTDYPVFGDDAEFIFQGLKLYTRKKNLILD